MEIYSHPHPRKLNMFYDEWQICAHPTDWIHFMKAKRKLIMFPRGWLHDFGDFLICRASPWITMNWTESKFLWNVLGFNVKTVSPFIESIDPCILITNLSKCLVPAHQIPSFLSAKIIVSSALIIHPVFIHLWACGQNRNIIICCCFIPLNCGMCWWS